MDDDGKSFSRRQGCVTSARQVAHFLLREPKGRVGRRSIGIIIDAAAVIGHSPLLEFSTLFFGGQYLVNLIREPKWGWSKRCIGKIQAAAAFPLTLDTVCWCGLR